ncbi:MAG TPA: SusD/RagB family nutrient-binding outer membrane lipoprotein [Parapedobacter sp.]|uniref:SusD/RagB family nutrient-binding outer membrane lipoprotein n=1 Tax=Parapedobacter sp. TaxID=1958893 RepID=UPI002C0D442A|nr:SusD/RagB family nutrient-binding outer membrane lipoprotein [Parapedobacter sp.]HWK57926.1 SusD/RagB family nutrient-binding outer membrane lipoprotein [Parapedobacter sp.]
MLRNKIIKIVCAIVLAVSFLGCKKYLTDLNIDPNGIQPETANPNLVLTKVLSSTGMAFTNLGYQDVAGVMQHTQKDGWADGHNNYDWGQSNDWSIYYDILRNNKFVYERAEQLGYDLQKGVSLVMKSMVFGLITDLFGDAPYTAALNADEGGNENMFPVFDKQRDIYLGILADLETANTLLSKSKNEYNSSIEAADIYYQGDPAKWRKLANSLRLRYLMRLSVKEPAIAKAGIEQIAGDPANNPIITTAADDANMPSWTPVYDVSESEYRRIKMCQTLVEAMRAGNDPRLGVWAKRVEIPIVMDETLPDGTDKIEDGKRYISPDILSKKGVTVDDISLNPDYVGLPPSYTAPAAYNLSPDVNQAAFNPHVSWLSDMYRTFNSPLLKSRLLSGSEVNFILAEAAWLGWSLPETAETYYNNAIKASLETWGVGDAYADFIAQPGVAYDGTQKQIIVQKWIASWQAATESWADYKRTGFPELHAGPMAIKAAVPVRFYYMLSERNLNKTNIEAAMENLEETPYSQSEGANSAWSKPWVIQGTGKPW